MGPRVAAVAAWCGAVACTEAAAVRCATSFEKLAPVGLAADDRFGAAVANVGDIDGDGVADLAVGAPGDNHGSFELSNNAGAVYFVLRGGDGSAKSSVKAVVDHGQKNDWFGSSVAAIGDLDGDGRSEVLVGAPYWDEKGRVDSGAIFVYSLEGDGSVKTASSYGAKNRGSAHLGSSDNFGISVAAAGDVDGDGIPDAYVGAHKYDDPETGAEDVGCVYVCFMSTRGAPRDCKRLEAAPLSATALSKSAYPVLGAGDYFGVALAKLPRAADGSPRRELRGEAA